MTFATQPRHAELRRMKRLATGLLLLVAAVFVASHFLPPVWWARCLKATAEAAMVGAVADWFAVSALFRRIPLPLVGRHTAIIPRNKDRIAANLAGFVRDKFLDADSLVALLRRNDPAQWMAQWLTEPGNSHVLGQQLARVGLGFLETVHDEQVARWLKRTLRRTLGQVDWGQGAATLLQVLTHEGKHHAVLDDVLQRVSQSLSGEATRRFIADGIVGWLKREHPLKEKVLPSDWLGDKGADLVAEALDSLLHDVAHNPEHRVRKAFDASLAQLIDRLRTDPAMAAKAQALRTYLLHDEKLGSYLQDLWQRWRQRWQAELADAQSPMAKRLASAGLWLGQSLAQDAALRQSLNVRLERWAQGLAPDVSDFIANHIRETVQRWDAQELSHLVEQHIGKDLQYIRINGTLVGGAVGLALFVVTSLAR